MIKPKPKPKRNTITPTFDDETYDDINECVERYGKDSMARVVVEVVKGYLPFYKKAEDARLAAYREQEELLGKATAPASSKERRARKTA